MAEPIRLLVVDDDDTFRTVLSAELRHRGYQVTCAATGSEALRAIGDAEAGSGPRVVLLDLRLPDMDGLEVLSALRERAGGSTEVIMLTGHGTIDTAIEAIRRGAFDYVSKPCPVDELEIRIGRAVECRALRERNTVLERALRPRDPTSVFVGASPAFHQLLSLVERVAPTDSTVLITGETGSGKEVLAKLIHARSRRAERSFVVVECAALQESLLLSELFGHERGAFTGADRMKPGLFEVAQGGTLFLDEIGEVSLATQVKLLRVLDTSTFRRVGGTSEIRADVRVVAATNRDLPALVRQGLFREDLYYRLSTIRIHIPPLRERKEDIEELVAHFVRLFCARFGVERRVGKAAMEAILAYDWPGNVRELYHAIEGAMVVCDGHEIRPEHLPAALRHPAHRTRPQLPALSPAASVAPAAAPRPAPAAAPDLGLVSLEELERAHIRRVLEATGGRRKEAARILGVSERNLYRKLRGK